MVVAVPALVVAVPALAVILMLVVRVCESP
jgi:hypothetical protein